MKKKNNQKITAKTKKRFKEKKQNKLCKSVNR